MSPKNLLRHPKCRSPLYEFDDMPDDPNIVGVRFKRLIMDDTGEQGEGGHVILTGVDDTGEGGTGGLARKCGSYHASTRVFCTPGQ